MEEHLNNLIAYLRKNQKGLRDDNKLMYYIETDELKLEFKYVYTPEKKEEKELPFWWINYKEFHKHS